MSVFQLEAAVAAVMKTSSPPRIPSLVSRPVLLQAPLIQNGAGRAIKTTLRKSPARLLLERLSYLRQPLSESRTHRSP